MLLQGWNIFAKFFRLALGLVVFDGIMRLLGDGAKAKAK